jgi:hypothetical protein
MVMKRLARLAALVLVSGALAVAAPAPANIAGQWQFTVELAMGTGNPVVTFVQDGEKITGTYEGRYGTSKLSGTVKENAVQFVVVVSAEGATVNGTFTGTYDAEKMKGEVDYEGAGGGTWIATRIPPKK